MASIEILNHPRRLLKMTIITTLCIFFFVFCCKLIHLSFTDIDADEANVLGHSLYSNSSSESFPSQQLFDENIDWKNESVFDVDFTDDAHFTFENESLTLLEKVDMLEKFINKQHRLLKLYHETALSILRDKSYFDCVEKSKLEAEALRAQKDLEIINESLMNNQLEEKLDEPKQMLLNDLPPSSIYCTENNLETRQCRIRNLYYNPGDDQFFIVHGNNTVILNAPEYAGQPLVDASSLSNHPVFTWNYVEVPFGSIKNQTVYIYEGKSFIFKRFHPGNIMHTLHDDFINLYHHLKFHGEYAPFSDAQVDGVDYPPFKKNIRLVATDVHYKGPYVRVFDLLTDKPIVFTEELSNSPGIYCFADAVVGQSKLVNWYQYGFAEPQGPIKNKEVSGYLVREVASYILRELSVPIWDRKKQEETLNYMAEVIELDETLSSLAGSSEFGKKEKNDNGALPPPPDDVFIAIFSRRGNRLLKNEVDLASKLSDIFQIPVKFIRNEDMTFEEQVAILSHSVLAIGAHGSLLIMGMFLPPGAILIEIYPYCVPADNYTPYKTMCRLPGMELTYRSWTNTDPDLNIMHPEYPTNYGGLLEFSDEKRQKILSTCDVPTHLCCYDPFWLFRIYQDTIIDIPSLLNTTVSSILEAEKSFNVIPTFDLTILPGPPLNNIRCMPVIQDPNGVGFVSITKPLSDETPVHLFVRWDAPWNVPRVDEYGIWVHEAYKEFNSYSNSYLIPNICTNRSLDVSVYLKSTLYTKNAANQTVKISSSYSPATKCSCSSSK